MPENATIPDGAASNQEVVLETAKEKFERERLSRRQALKKFGMTSALSAFALFSVDDLARMVGKTMQQRAGDDKVATLVAKELQHAGVVLADTPQSCTDCCSHNNASLTQSNQLRCDCDNAAVTAHDFAVCKAEDDARFNNILYAYNSPGGCFWVHCQPQGLHCPPLSIGPCIQAVAN